MYRRDDKVIIIIVKRIGFFRNRVRRYRARCVHYTTIRIEFFKTSDLDATVVRAIYERTSYTIRFSSWFPSLICSCVPIKRR